MSGDSTSMAVAHKRPASDMEGGGESAEGRNGVVGAMGEGLRETSLDTHEAAHATASTGGASRPGESEEGGDGISGARSKRSRMGDGGFATGGAGGGAGSEGTSASSAAAVATSAPTMSAVALAKAKATSSITLTFGDVAENHAGMQKIGEEAAEGFSIADFDEAVAVLSRLDSSAADVVERVRLNEALPEGLMADDEAEVLIIRGGVALLGGDADAVMAEQLALSWDTKAWMRGRVVNKRARYNLCFAEAAQEPDYAAKRGRVVAYDALPHLSALRSALPGVLGPKAAGLACEGNYYYDLADCGIGFHGDGERCKVVAARLGADMPLDYQWFHAGRPVGRRVSLTLHHGDVYVMSAKAAGKDWRCPSRVTLRHAAGSLKFRTIKRK
uniref:Alpha-ketoglutarate-dependent dioxygenase AlkB-like domain-containing protein n=1 Tax=Bicosoecida sp. CB-2014 TaxID=1486930 RepID=A0A7S1CPM1_9STRA|mmetsp:Transcript_7151/g.25511  ORF Transcript_7151/g.25511 Transcript_7151/m.25511 type:complete len:387 (+) Transcript_7151:22-1182(+)